MWIELAKELLSRPDRFNRYMVECELLLFYKVPERRSSFNRYMVECESRSSTAILVAVIVLIDTWWNVNQDHQPLS